MFSRLRPKLSRQFGLFLLVGGTAAAAQWLSRFGFNLYLPYGYAVAAAYGVGVLVAFELNRRFVFTGVGDSRARQFVRFLLVNCLSFVVVWIVAMALGGWLLPKLLSPALSEAIGHGVAILSPAVLSYALHKHFTFRAAPAPAVVNSGGEGI